MANGGTRHGNADHLQVVAVPDAHNIVFALLPHAAQTVLRPPLPRIHPEHAMRVCRGPAQIATPPPSLFTSECRSRGCSRRETLDMFGRMHHAAERSDCPRHCSSKRIAEKRAGRAAQKWKADHEAGQHCRTLRHERFAAFLRRSDAAMLGTGGPPLLVGSLTEITPGPGRGHSFTAPIAGLGQRLDFFPHSTRLRKESTCNLPAAVHRPFGRPWDQDVLPSV